MADAADQPLFAELSEGELSLLESLGSREICLQPGESLAVRADIRESFFLLLDGELRALRRGSHENVVVGVAADRSSEADPAAADGRHDPQSMRAARYRAGRPVLLATHLIAAASALEDCCLLEIPADAYLDYIVGLSPANRIIVSSLVQRVQMVETALLQRDKLSTLGKLAAGLAHDLNNPAAAAARSASQLASAIGDLQSGAVDLIGQPLPLERSTRLVALLRETRERYYERSRSSDLLQESALARAALEEQVATWLDGHGVADAWALAPSLVDGGLDLSWLENLTQVVTPEAVPRAIAWIGGDLATAGLLREVRESANRISELVAGVKTYVNMDRAPVQPIDVHEGLESTLAILRHRLRGVEVVRDYDRTLPQIVANAGELNQVWTNLIDNAVDALGGHGQIRVRTWREGNWAIVEVADNGPGIPPEIQPRIFEAFFTTKPGGKGMGLGLDISYRIITGTHHGDIRVSSVPGDTRFDVCLPITDSGQ